MVARLAWCSDHRPCEAGHTDEAGHTAVRPQDEPRVMNLLLDQREGTVGEAVRMFTAALPTHLGPDFAETIPARRTQPCDVIAVAGARRGRRSATQQPAEAPRPRRGEPPSGVPRQIGRRVPSLKPLGKVVPGTQRRPPPHDVFGDALPVALGRDADGLDRPGAS